MTSKRWPDVPAIKSTLQFGQTFYRVLKAPLAILFFWVLCQAHLSGQAPDKAVHIPGQETTRVLWGDEISGKVHDSFFVMSSKIYQLIYGMAPGEVFRHSDQFPTLFSTDAVYFVLRGTLLLNNPETGEVHVVKPGEAAFLPRDNWNYGFSYATEPLSVLEYYIPPNERGYSDDGSTLELEKSKYAEDRWLGQWPAAKTQANQVFSTRVLGDSDVLWRLEGEKTQVLVGILASSDQLTVGKALILPGQESEPRLHGGDACFYLLEGALHIRLPDHVIDERGQTEWLNLKAEDGAFVPEGTRYQLYNPSTEITTIVFGISPSYLPRE